jgi:hypothetical protein
MVSDQQRKILAIIGSVIFLLIAPMTVVGWIPWWITRWQMESSLGSFALLRVVGGLLKFSEEYETFCAHVPRWIPRFRPWDDGA